MLLQIQPPIFNRNDYESLCAFYADYPEEYKDIQGHEGRYQISNMGNVKSLIGKEKILSPYKVNGYPKIDLRTGIGYSERKVRVHKLVALHFVPNPDPQNKNEVNHLFGNKEDNRWFLLEWVTKQENMTHASKSGLLGKITWKQVAEIREMRMRGHTHSYIAQFYPITTRNVCQIVNNKTWKD